MIKNNDEYGFLIPENHQIHENAIQAMSFRDRVKAALFEGVHKDKYESPETLPDDDAISFVQYLVSRQKYWKRDDEVNQFAIEVKQLLIDLVGKDISNDEAIAKIKELAEQTQILGEIGDILRMANGECFDYRRFKQLIEFRDQVKKLLFHNPLQESSETTIDKLKEVINSNSRLHEFWLTIMDLVGADLSSCHDSIDDFAISKIKQLLSVKVGDVQITGNPSEVAEALRKEVEVYREPLSNEQTVIANLRHDLLVANKVIARLVGE
jgi:hypothetical protein